MWNFDNLPINRINQTFLSMYRSCHAKAKYYAISSEQSIGSFNMLNGSVLHLAFNDLVNAYNKEDWYEDSRFSEYWWEVIERVMDANPNQRYESYDVELYIKRLAGQKGAKIDVGKLLIATFNSIGSFGLSIVGGEVRINWNPPGSDIEFYGTIDVVARNRNGIVLIDMKTSGIGRAIIDGTSTKKETYTEEQVAFHQQLIHYTWLGYEAGEWGIDDVSHVGILVPTNLVPYKTGIKAGQAKGLPLYLAKIDRDAILRYREDVQSWLKMMNEGNYQRMYPSVYGKIECLKCPFNDICFSRANTELPTHIRGRNEK